MALCGVLGMILAGCVWTDPEDPDADLLEEEGNPASAEPAAPLPYGKSAPQILGWGDTHRQLRAITPFDKIVVHGQVTLVLTQARKENLYVEAQTNILEHLLSEVRGTTLYVGYKSDPDGPPIRATEPVRFHVEAKELNDLSVEKGAKANITGLRSARLRIDMNGDSRMTMDHFEGDALLVSLRDFSAMEVRGGWSTRQQIQVHGNCHYTAPSFDTEVTEIRVTGLGKAEVRVKKELTVQVVGEGIVRYHGDPLVHKEGMGEGRIKRVGP
jgi:hypothetical protein